MSRSHLVFRYNEHGNISGLDPAFSRTLQDNSVCNQLFNGLVQLDDRLNIQPCIAKRWWVSDDALTYRFTLRSDVFFHKDRLFGKDSTRTVIASDFVYSFNRLRSSKLAAPGRWVLNKVRDFKALNDSLFEITLKEPFPAFVGLLSMKYCSVVPQEIVQHYGRGFRRHPIGTGPFFFKHWEENIKLVFRRNSMYFERDKKGNRLPYLEAVAITFLSDKQSEFLQFKQGNIDFLNSLDASYKDELLTAKGALREAYVSSTKMLKAPYLNTEYLGFYLDSKTPEIQSKQLRKAINYGFDRRKMIAYLRNGIGTPANGGFIPLGLRGHATSIGYSYQPQRAKALIDAFKKTHGIEHPKVTLSTTSSYLNFCEFIQRELEKVGLDIRIDVMPEASLRTARSNGKVDLFRGSWIADYLDAENYLSLFYSKHFAPRGVNYFHYKNPLFDSLYDSSFYVKNVEKRAKQYRTMDSLAMEDAVMVPLYYDEVIRFTQKNVTGLGVNPTNLLDLRYVQKKPLDRYYTK